MANRTIGALVASVLILASCGDDDSASNTTGVTASTTSEPPATDPPATDPPATEPVPTDPPATDPPATDPPATDPPATDPPASAPPLPDTPGTAPIDTTYDFSGGAPDPALLPAQPGEVIAKWYRAGPTYAVVYDGLPADVAACPGNSAQTTAGFDFVSNAPTPSGDCGDFETAIESTAAQGVQVCNDRLSYLTIIPADTVAVLFSSIEVSTDGGGVGLTGFYPVEDPGLLPEIDPAELAC